MAKVKVAKLQAALPYVCASFKPVKGKEKANSSNKSYSFDRTDQIFDVLLQDKQIILLEGKKMPSIQEIKKSKILWISLNCWTFD